MHRPYLVSEGRMGVKGFRRNNLYDRQRLILGSWASSLCTNQLVIYQGMAGRVKEGDPVNWTEAGTMWPPGGVMVTPGCDSCYIDT